MRLTLRTMLAYLDEILEPADHTDIGKKIEESEFATGLVRRIREVARRLRLPAPKLTGKGIAADPNTVSEYLDNTLASERVADFEKVCLESDMHLAEVASCHQILTLVLGEPAEVDPALRRRMYGVLARSEEQPAAPDAVSTALAAPLPPEGDVATPRRKPEVPDYLREPSRSRWWTVLAAVLLLVLLSGVVVLAIGPLDASHPIARLLGWDDREVAEAPAPRPVGQSSLEPEDELLPEAVVPATDTPPVDAPEEDEAPPAPAAPLPEETPGEPNRLPVAATDEPGDLGQPPLPDEPLPGEPLPGEPMETDLGPDGEAMPAEGASVPPRFADGFNPIPSEPGAGDAQPMAPVGENTTTPAEGETRPAAGRIGRYVSDQEILLRRTAAAEDWNRVPPLASFGQGDTLIALPAFRPRITLPSGLTLQIGGETSLRIAATAEAAAGPALELDYGRIIILSGGTPGSQLRLDVAGRTATAFFDDVDSVLALETTRRNPPGQDPERATQPIVETRLYVLSGEVTWTDRGGQVFQLPGSTQVVLAPDAEPRPMSDTETPAWIGSDQSTSLDRRAAASLEQALTPERSAMLSLREQAAHRRLEIRSLAARSLALLNVFEPTVEILSDVEQRALWPLHLESLRAAIGRGPQVAAQVRQAFEAKRGDEAAGLYRMLWGYTPAGLAGGEAARLVEYLDHPALDYRVMAFENLRMITGRASAYRPEQTSVARAQAVRKWKEDLQAGRIAPKPADSTPAGTGVPGVSTQPLPGARPSAPPAAPAPMPAASPATAPMPASEAASPE